MSSKLYVGNLSFKMSDQDLETVFAEYGKVVSAKIIMDRDTGRSKGFGFVEMETSDDAQEAISSLDGSEKFGRNIRVSEALDKRRSGGPGQRRDMGDQGRY